MNNIHVKNIILTDKEKEEHLIRLTNNLLEKEDIEKLIEDIKEERYKLDIIKYKDIAIGYYTYIKIEEAKSLFINHLEIDKSYRGIGLGGLILKYIKRIMQVDYILFEIDNIFNKISKLNCNNKINREIENYMFYIKSGARLIDVDNMEENLLLVISDKKTINNKVYNIIKENNKALNKFGSLLSNRLISLVEFANETYSINVILKMLK